MNNSELVGLQEVKLCCSPRITKIVLYFSWPAIVIELFASWDPSEIKGPILSWTVDFILTNFCSRISSPLWSTAVFCVLCASCCLLVLIYTRLWLLRDHVLKDMCYSGCQHSDWHPSFCSLHPHFVSNHNIGYHSQFEVTVTYLFI